MFNFNPRVEDIFGGGGGSQGQGTPTATHSGGGDKAAVVNDWLGRITGAYNLVSGQGNPIGPAPDTRSGNQKNSAVQGTNKWMVIGAVVVAVAVFFFIRRK
jgi:hypothetical protein